MREPRTRDAADVLRRPALRGPEADAVRNTAYSAAFAALTDTDDPADAAVRADLLLAWLLGIAQLRSVLRTGSLLDADGATVTVHVPRTARMVLHGS